MYVDIEGYLLHVEVSPANIHDTKVGGLMIEVALEKYPTILAAASRDAGYRSTTVDYSEIIMDTPVHISMYIQEQFAILPKRWIIERTFAWINNDRRLTKDYDSQSKPLIKYGSNLYVETDNEKILSIFMKTGS